MDSTSEIYLPRYRGEGGGRVWFIGNRNEGWLYCVIRPLACMGVAGSSFDIEES